MRHLCLSVALLIAAASASAQEAPQRQFSKGIAGSNAPDPKDRASVYFGKPKVRALLERLEPAPLPKAEVEAALSGSDTTIADLLRTKILRDAGTTYAINFDYFTLADIRRIRAVGRKHVPLLARAYADSAPELDRVLSMYDVPSVDKKKLAYALIAGIALNWDGLKLTEDLGYRKPVLVAGTNWQYSFWVEEKDPEFSTKGMIWGSSPDPTPKRNFDPPIDYSFTSYGDPDSYERMRMNLPDVILDPPEELQPGVRGLAEKIGFVDETVGGSEFKSVLGSGVGRSIGSMLFALREGPKRLEELRAVVRTQDAGKVADIAALLEEIEYVRKRPDDRYELLVPVLDRRDAPMVDQFLRLHRSILTKWLAEHYPTIKSELADVTVMRHGMPFEGAFTQIWHEYFGLATLELTRAGVIADPYAPSVKYPGSYGLVWRHSLYSFDWR